MKVADLQHELAKLDPNLDVLCYTEDVGLASKERAFVLLDVVGVSITQAERLRLNDGTPYLKLGSGARSSDLAIVEVTSDF